MSAIQIIGALLVASPFAGLFVFSVRELGWRETFFGLVGILALMLVILSGTFLLAGGVSS